MKVVNRLVLAWREFLKSFRIKPDRIFGELKGEDHLGNKYYEIGPDPQGGRSRPSRWFESLSPDDYNQEIPIEWAAWLRRQRNNPPTNEEIIRNMAIYRMKKENAMKKEEEYKSTPKSSSINKFK